MRRSVTRSVGFVAGLFAMLATVTVTLLVSNVTHIVALSDIAADRFTSLVPITVFSAVLDRLLFRAKELLEIGILLGQVLIGGLIGLLYAAYQQRLGSSPPPAPASRHNVSAVIAPVWGRDAIVIAALLLLACEVVILPLFGSGLFGLLHRPPLGISHIALAAELLLFAAVLTMVVARVTTRRTAQLTDGSGPTRRALLADAIACVGLIGLSAAAVKAFVLKPLPRLGFTNVAGLSPAVTPIPNFYQVSKNFENPVVDPSTWRLQIGGLVARPRSYQYADIIGHSSIVEQYGTLECISNSVGGDLLSNGLWKGIRLADILHEAGTQPGAQRLVITAADGYTDSIPMDNALQPTTLLAFLLNGSPLTADHGFPVRLIVPGIYGMKNVKWMTKIEPSTDGSYRGYWETRGWSNEAVVKTMSRIDVPADGQKLPAGPHTIGGVAFAGDRGISRVEISADGGRVWRQAHTELPLGPFAWVRWMLDWNPTPGHYHVVVRAADGTGALQTALAADPVPDGASGYHEITVTTV